MTDDKVNRDWNYDIHQAVYPLFKFRGALAGHEADELSPEDCADIICDAIKDIVADIEFRLSWWEGNFGQGVYAPSKEYNGQVMLALDALETPEMQERLAASAAAMETALASGQPGLTLDEIAQERDPEKYRTRTDPDAAYEAFMSMPEDEWLGLLLSLAGGGVLEPAEQQGLARAMVERVTEHG